MKALPIILASQSPRRRELFHLLNLPFQVVPSVAKEVHDKQLTAWEMAQVNAYRKARAVARRFPDALVIGADTMVYLDRDTRLFGKPTSPRDAADMLKALSGRVHAVITGVCLLHLRARHRRVFTDWTDVQFHPLTATQIRAYLRLIDPLDKAGAYAIQEHGDRIIAALFGSYSNVVGLPLERLREELKAFGFFQRQIKPLKRRSK